jgi:glucose-6-phosphate isomerase
MQSAAFDRAASAVQAGVDHLRKEQFFTRLGKQDPSLWSANPAVQTTIRNRLGWVTIANVMASQQDEVRRIAEDLRETGFTHALLLGMGGSGLFAEVCRHLFGIAEGALDVQVLDTTDPTAVRQALRCSPHQLCVVISSKSGATAEISALSKYFHQLFKDTDKKPGAHCVVITDAGTALEQQAKEWWAARHLLVHGPGSGLEVGGRFSALTYFGLLPAALMGIDTDRLLERAHAMFQQCGSDVPIDMNPAAQLGAAMATLAEQGRDKLTLLCSPALASFGTWVEQLVAESTGKNGHGLAPIVGEPVREPAQYSSDRLFVELQLAGQRDEGLAGRVDALSKAGHPVMRIQWQDTYDLGGEVAKWCVATAAAGFLLKINPFDEPNVKESKDRTKALLSYYTSHKQFPEAGPPIVAEDDVAAFGHASVGATTLAQTIAAFLTQARTKDYFAILSFLPRTQTLDQSLEALRQRLGNRSGRAVMLGFGPRYLHSTGQLYKGGPNHGVFLLLTSDEREDLPIPGEAFSFGVLKQAQALGDFQAMEEHHRRVLRLHLKGNPESGIRRVLDLSEEAFASATRRA